MVRALSIKPTSGYIKPQIGSERHAIARPERNFER